MPISPISPSSNPISSASKKCIIILIVLLIGSLGFAALSVLEKQKLQHLKAQLEGQLKTSEDQQTKAVLEMKDLKNRVEKITQDKDALREELSQTQKKADALTSELSDVKKSRGDWESELKTIKEERDALTKREEELKDQVKKLEEQVETYKTAQATVPSPTPAVSEIVIPEGQEGDWASLLKEKAALQIKTTRLEEDLSKRSTEILSLKQQNEDLQIKLETLEHAKEEIAHDIQDKTSLVDNLAAELARAKNDKKFMSDRFTVINTENKRLRSKLKELASSKKSLENSIVQLIEHKNEISKKLDEAEGMVQRKIDEIWGLKDEVAATLKNSQAVLPPADSSDGSKLSQLELEPIVVNGESEKSASATSSRAQESLASATTMSSSSAFNGRILSINEDNNFVILDIGEQAGLRLGELLNVYRDSQYIGQVQVIQLRKNIAAADLKSQWTKIQVGDQVK